MGATSSVMTAFAHHPDALSVIETSPGPLGRARIAWVNKAFERLYGFTNADVVNTRFEALWLDDTDAAHDFSMIEDQSRCVNARHRLGDGESRPMDIFRVSDSTHDGMQLQVFLHKPHSVHLAEKLRVASAERSAQIAEQRLWDSIEALPEGFIILDSADRVIAFNSKFKDLYGSSSPAIRIGATFESILRYGIENGQYPEATDNEEAWLAERLDRGNRLNRSVERELPDGRFILIQDVETPSGDMVGLRSDITLFKTQESVLMAQTKALQHAEKQARREALTDALTGLGNRRGLDDYLARFAHAGQPERELALLHVDLDRFKGINDMFGHAAGDKVLLHVSGILSESVRPDDFVARVGGDEFVVVVVVASDARVRAESVAERIVEKCRVPVRFEDKELRFGASIGVAVATTRNTQGLLENADIALYEAKGSGRGQSALFSPELRQIAEDKKRLADELLTAMVDDQLVAYFQPQVDANDYSLTGAEALVRWKHPTEGVLGPGQFLPIAEELGILADIDERVLHQALATVEDMAGRGVVVPKISVNVSYRRLQNPLLFNCLDRWKDRPCRIAFELLETIDFDQDADGFAWVLDGLREQGIEIEIDDFGSGRASLTTLLRLFPDRLKMDGMLVASMERDVPGARQMVQAISDICKSTSIGLTAEGVETKEQAETLASMGTSVLQGYYFSRPLSAEDFERWVIASRDGAAPQSA